MFSQGERSKHSILAQPTFETVIAMIADDDFLNDEDHELSWRTITIMFFFTTQGIHNFDLNTISS